MLHVTRLAAVVLTSSVSKPNTFSYGNPPGGGGVLGFMFAGYVPLASQSPYPIIVYFWANYRDHLSHF